MTRLINSAGLALIRECEGLRLEAYQDTADPPIWTIGYGHTRGVKKGDTCSQIQAEDWLEADLLVAEDEVQRCVKVKLTDNQYSALVSFAFNEKDFHSSTLVKKLNEGDYSSVPDELRRWIYSGGKKSSGLIRRRRLESELWSMKNEIG